MSALHVLSLLLAFCAGVLTDALLAARRRRLRRGGYVRPPASSGTSPRTDGGSTTPRIPVGSSSPLAPGHLSAVAAVRLTPPPPNNDTGHGWSIRVPDGGGGTGRTPPAPADSADPPGAELLRRNRGDDAA